MSIDYMVYFGPYIEVKTKGLTRKQKYDYQACINPSCNDYRKAKYDGKFCPTCGDPLAIVNEIIEENWCAVDMIDEMDIGDQVFADFTDESNGDTQIFFPNHDLLESGNKSGCKSVKYDTLWIDLTGLDTKEEVEKVREHCAKALDVLEKIYGVKPVIKWGILSTAG